MSLAAAREHAGDGEPGDAEQDDGHGGGEGEPRVDVALCEEVAERRRGRPIVEPVVAGGELVTPVSPRLRGRAAQPRPGRCAARLCEPVVGIGSLRRIAVGYRPNLPLRA